MEWRDEGVILSMRRHGESAAIVEALTAAHGRHAGVVRGGGSRKMAPVLQPGGQVALVWRARLDDHIGTFAVEPLRSRAGLMADGAALAALGSVCALLRLALPERAPCPVLWQRTVALLDLLEAGKGWATAYLHWEIRLLEDMGFGLDLSCCAVTGAVEGLAHVSPRTGRAVSRAGAGDWADRLFPLPPCLLAEGKAPPGEAPPLEIAQGLAITGHFLARELGGGGTLPEARARLLVRLVAGPASGPDRRSLPGP